MDKQIAGTIGILGCGWLGRPLGQTLSEAGFSVKGATTTPEKMQALEKEGLTPFLVRLVPGVEGGEAEDFFRADLLVLTVPPPRERAGDERAGDEKVAFYREQMQAAASAARAGGVKHLIYTSSTGVYPPLGREVTEDDAPTDWQTADLKRESAQAVLAAEHVLRESARGPETAGPGFDLTVVRLAGLYGPGREPGRFLAGRTHLTEGGRPVNFVHQRDAIGVVKAIIEEEAFGGVFNACADRHPSRRVFFRQRAQAAGLEPPTFADDEKGAFKIVSNAKAKRHLGYTFRHPDPLENGPLEQEE